MTGKSKFRFEEAAKEIDLRLGDLLGQLGEALSEAAQSLENSEDGEIRREREFETGHGSVRASAGIRIRTLGGQTKMARPTEERRTDIPVNSTATPNEASAKPKAPTARKVEATIFEEPDHWSLVADVPGIIQTDVIITTTGDVLRIQAANAHRHYILETSQPPGWTQFDCTVTNGVLEVCAHSPERKS